MPKLKQPPLLRDVAAELLSTIVSEYCVRLVDKVNTSNLHEDLKWLKLQVCNCVPAPYFDKFILRVLQEISYLLGRRLMWISLNHIDSLLDTITDSRLKKLESLPLVSDSLLIGIYRNLAKLNGLEIVDISTFFQHGGSPNDTRHCMTALTRMKNLTTLTYRVNCTDEVLEAIGQSCFQLKYLDVSSSGVTDRGICSMRRCTRLKTVQLKETRVTSNGFLELLSTHPNIEDLGYFDKLHLNCYENILSGIPNGNTNLRHFHFPKLFEPDLVLLATKCPHLKSITITDRYCYNIVFRDLPIPAEFRELEKLVCDSVVFVDGFIPFVPFDRLQIKSLDFGWRLDKSYSLNTENFNLISRTCPNLKYFKFTYSDSMDENILVIPELRHLETLEICTLNKVFQSNRRALDFDRLKSLKTLHYAGFIIPIARMLTIIRDSTNFPELSKIVTDDATAEIEIFLDIIQRYNLDLTIEWRSAKYD